MLSAELRSDSGFPFLIVSQPTSKVFLTSKHLLLGTFWAGILAFGLSSSFLNFSARGWRDAGGVERAEKVVVFRYVCSRTPVLYAIVSSGSIDLFDSFPSGKSRESFWVLGVRPSSTPTLILFSASRSWHGAKPPPPVREFSGTGPSSSSRDRARLE